jgi:methionyl-tRNA formyltransferase
LCLVAFILNAFDVELLTNLLRIVYIGSRGPLSVIPLAKLLGAGQSLCAIGVDTDDTARPRADRIPVTIEDQGSVEFLAGRHGIPLIRLQGAWSASVDEIAEYMPHIILVSCFARRLPDVVLSIPSMGCFNLHPSLLPAYRGPLPLFWQFRDGCREFGVTLHHMTSRLDAGDIVGQTRLVMPDGVSGRRASVLLAEAGGDLLVDAVSALGRGKAAAIPQNERAASYQGYPVPSDCAVSANWSARRLYNFVCATRGGGMRYPCDIGGRVYRLSDVVSWREAAATEPLISGNTVTIPCNPGYVVARVETD